MKNKVIAGVDFGGTRIKLALIAKDQIICQNIIEAESMLSFEQRLKDILLEIKPILSQNNLELEGIGLAFPGIVNFEKNAILSKYVKYPGAEDIDLNYWAKTKLDVPIIIENDARAAMIGEWKHGAGRGAENLVSIMLGTGFGTGVLVNGKPLRGKNFIAGNLGGHTTINFNGEVCNCGNIGCVESESSTWALNKLAQKSVKFKDSQLALNTELNFKILFELAEKGDQLANELKDQCLRVWSHSVINLIHAYDPEKVILGGGIMRSGHLILPYIREMIDRHAWICSSDLELVKAEHLENAGIFGVYELLKSKK